MKRIYFSLFIISVFLFSCKDDDTIEISTSIPIPIAVQVSESAVSHQESGQEEYSFTASQTYHLSDNEDVKNYLDHMNYIEFKEQSFGISGLEDGEVIKYIELSAGDDNNFITFENVTNSNYGTEGSYGFLGHGLIGNILLTDKEITVTVSGTTNKAPMDFDIDLVFRIAVHTEEI